MQAARKRKFTLMKSSPLQVGTVGAGRRREPTADGRIMLGSNSVITPIGNKATLAATGPQSAPSALWVYAAVLATIRQLGSDFNRKLDRATDKGPLGRDAGIARRSHRRWI